MERIAFLIAHTHQQLRCLLNPDSLVMRRVAGIKPRRLAAGRLTGGSLADDPLLFTGGGRTEMDLQLLFDVSVPGSSLSSIDSPFDVTDVRALTRPLWDLAENSMTARDDGRGYPPIVRLIWGKAWNEPGVVVAVSERLEHFTAAGVPRRSWLTLRLLRVKDTDSSSAMQRLAAAAVELAAAAGEVVHEITGALAAQATAGAGEPPEELHDVADTDELVTAAFDETLVALNALWDATLGPAVAALADFFTFDKNSSEDQARVDKLVDDKAPAAEKKKQRDVMDSFADTLRDVGNAVLSLFGGDDDAGKAQSPARARTMRGGKRRAIVPLAAGKRAGAAAPARPTPRSILAVRAGNALARAEAQARATVDAVGSRLDAHIHATLDTMVRAASDAARGFLGAPVLGETWEEFRKTKIPETMSVAVRAARRVEIDARALIAEQARRIKDCMRVLDAAISAAATSDTSASSRDSKVRIDEAARLVASAIATLTGTATGTAGPGGGAAGAASATGATGDGVTGVSSAAISKALERIYTSLDGLHASGQDMLVRALSDAAAVLENARRNTEAAERSSMVALYRASVEHIDGALAVLSSGSSGGGSAGDGEGDGDSGTSLARDKVLAALDVIAEAVLACSEPPPPDRTALDDDRLPVRVRMAAAAATIRNLVSTAQTEILSSRRATVTRASLTATVKSITAARQIWLDAGQAVSREIVCNTAGRAIKHPPATVERLDQVAYRYYGQPASWRLLCEYNGIDDPLEMSARPALRIPPLSQQGTRTR